MLVLYINLYNIMAVKKSGVGVGALRKGSYNKAIGQYRKDNAPEGNKRERVKIGKLARLDQGYEERGEPRG